MTKILAAILISIALVGCKKPDPHPELKDPIYSDLQAQLGAVTAALNAERKTLADHQKTLSEVKPQTGQIKYATKRVNESQQKINRLEQEEKYLSLKVVARQKSARKSYFAAFKKEEAWPNPDEFRAYQSEMRLRNAKKTWDVKQRLAETGLGDGARKPAAAAGGEHGAAPPPAEH